MDDHKQMIASAVVFYLLHSRPTLDKTLAPLLLQREELLKGEDAVLHPEVDRQFEEAVKRKVASKIAFDLKATPDEVYEIIENMNVKDFLEKKVG